MGTIRHLEAALAQLADSCPDDQAKRAFRTSTRSKYKDLLVCGTCGTTSTGDLTASCFAVEGAAVGIPCTGQCTCGKCKRPCAFVRELELARCTVLDFGAMVTTRPAQVVQAIRGDQYTIKPIAGLKDVGDGEFSPCHIKAGSAADFSGQPFRVDHKMRYVLVETTREPTKSDAGYTPPSNSSPIRVMPRPRGATPERRPDSEVVREAGLALIPTDGRVDGASTLRPELGLPPANDISGSVDDAAVTAIMIQYAAAAASVGSMPSGPWDGEVNNVRGKFSARPDAKQKVKGLVPTLIGDLAIIKAALGCEAWRSGPSFRWTPRSSCSARLASF